MENLPGEENAQWQREFTDYLKNQSQMLRNWSKMRWMKELDKKVPHWRSTVRQVATLIDIRNHAGMNYKSLLGVIVDELPDSVCSGLLVSSSDEEFEVSMNALNKVFESAYLSALNIVLSVFAAFLWVVIFGEAILFPGNIPAIILSSGLTVLGGVVWYVIAQKYPVDKKQQQKFRALLRGLKISAVS